jgi:Cd2+/Zn2+-exporting ATPase
MANVQAHCAASGNGCGCENSSSCDPANRTARKRYLPPVISLVILGAGLIFDFSIRPDFFTGAFRLGWYIVAYLPVAIPVWREAGASVSRNDFFNEYTLMSVATVGAFFIGELPEGVAVMLFYSVGELFQESAVNQAQGSIKALLDVRPDTATVLRDEKLQTVSPESVSVGETIQVKAGEKVPLDGVLSVAKGRFNTAALTGESVPRTIRRGESVLAGMVTMDTVVELVVEKKYEDSSLARILELVRNASSRKAKTELLIRKFAHVYTPVVFFLALAITSLPAFFVADYVLADWLYRALVFLVISCPCALVVSVPLSYFGGIGAASRHGILFKGANYLELMTKVNTVVLDKTGTLTEGVFKVRKVVAKTGDRQLFGFVAALEAKSNHPIAKAVTEHFSDIDTTGFTVENITEIPGYGMKGFVNGQEVLIGNSKLMKRDGLDYDDEIDAIKETTILFSLNNRYAGYLVIADKIKEDAALAIEQLYRLGVKNTVVLSGDKSAIVSDVASQLKIKESYGDLLPENKVSHLERLKSVPSHVVAFAGDGINDAPALALSDIGIAMGGMGSDAAIEVADLVIQTDQPSKIATAIKIGKATHQIVIQNIVLALGIKFAVLLLGVMGIATMWEAVFADVGVSFLAILNAIRIFRVDPN